MRAGKSPTETGLSHCPTCLSALIRVSCFQCLLRMGGGGQPPAPLHAAAADAGCLWALPSHCLAFPHLVLLAFKSALIRAKAAGFFSSYVATPSPFLQLLVYSQLSRCQRLFPEVEGAGLPGFLLHCFFWGGHTWNGVWGGGIVWCFSNCPMQEGGRQAGWLAIWPERHRADVWPLGSCC